LTGPDLGIPNLTPRAWYEAQFGDGSWEALGLMPKELWAQYLAWYRETLRIPVEPNTTVGALKYDSDARHFLVPCSGPKGERLVRAGGVVLATGIYGAGTWRVPRAISAALTTRLCQCTRHASDF